MAEQTKTTNLCRVAPVVAQPELIRITTIKRKHLEQMPSLNLENLEGVEVVGATLAKVLVRCPNGRLATVTSLVWLEHLAAPAVAHGADAYRAANEALRNYPQLFED